MNISITNETSVNASYDLVMLFVCTRGCKCNNLSFYCFFHGNTATAIVTVNWTRRGDGFNEKKSPKLTNDLRTKYIAMTFRLGIPTTFER